MQSSSGDTDIVNKLTDKAGSRGEEGNTESSETQADSFLPGVRYGCPPQSQPVASFVILVHGVLIDLLTKTKAMIL